MGEWWEPFTLKAVQRAVLAIFLVGIPCAVMGCFVVLRRMAFIGDALAHTVLPGIVIAFLKGANLFFGALVAGIITSLGIGWLSRRKEVREDTAIGILFTAMFALGILLMGQTGSFRDFEGILFGNILYLDRLTLQAMAVLGGLSMGILFLVYKEMELVSYDDAYARVIGICTEKLRYLLLLLLAFTVVGAIQAVGVILTSALLITPAATAGLLTKRLPMMMFLASIFAVLGGLGGLTFSVLTNFPSGAAIVLFCTLFFGLAYLWRGWGRRFTNQRSADPDRAPGDPDKRAPRNGSC